MKFKDDFIKSSLLDKIKDNTLGENHKEELGFEIPENYFSKSKLEIQQKVFTKKTGIFNLTSKQLKFRIPMAAAIALLFTLAVFKFNSTSELKNLPNIVLDSIKDIQPNEFKNHNNLVYEDIAIESLFINDEDVDKYLEDYVFESLVIEN
ncbi:hypothetical protein [Lutibacter oceani]|nr:hypothetical protein [Lutibacter oceani]